MVRLGGLFETSSSHFPPVRTLLQCDFVITNNPCVEQLRYYYYQKLQVKEGKVNRA